jgi:hypothetical protein
MKESSLYYEVPKESTELNLFYKYRFLKDKKVKFKIDISLD